MGMVRYSGVVVGIEMGCVCAIFKRIVGFERGVQKRRALITDDNIRMRVAHQGTR